MILAGEAAFNYLVKGTKALWALRSTSKATTEVATTSTELVGQNVIQTTAHGAERVAGATATRGGVLSVEGINTTKTLGRTITQKDGANVFLHEVTPGKFNVVIEGNKGIITTMENWSQKSINKIAKNYGWKL